MQKNHQCSAFVVIYNHIMNNINDQNTELVRYRSTLDDLRIDPSGAF